MIHTPTARKPIEYGRLLLAFFAVERLKLRQSWACKAMWIVTAVTPVVALVTLAQFDGEAVAFPRALELIGAFLLILTTMNVLLLTTTVLGGEFEHETMRVVIQRGIPRWLFVLGKMGTLSYAALIYALTGWACGSVAALISQAIRLGPQGGLWLWTLVLCTSGLDAAIIAVLAAAAYAGLALAAGMIVRSPAWMLFIGLGLFLGDLLVNGDLGFEASLGTYQAASIFYDAMLLSSRLRFPMAPLEPIQHASANVHPQTALLVLMGYALGGTAIAIYLLNRQDLDAAR